MMATRCRLTHQQKKIICQFSVDNPDMAQAHIVTHFNTNSSDPVVQVMPVALSKIIDHLHDVQDHCMSRNDLQYVTETLGSLILQVEQQQQNARTTQTYIVSFFRQLLHCS